MHAKVAFICIGVNGGFRRWIFQNFDFGQLFDTYTQIDRWNTYWQMKTKESEESDFNYNRNYQNYKNIVWKITENAWSTLLFNANNEIPKLAN